MTTLPENMEPSAFESFPAFDRIGLLVDALKERFDMDDEDAAAIAEIVEEQFRGETEVNDDNLDPEVRSIFYTLEAKKLLSFRREEYSIETGERRRAFFWRLRNEEITRAHAEAQAIPNDNVYDALPGSVWARNAS